MAKKLHRLSSFRSVLSISFLICWILPIVIISTAAGMLLNRTYNRNLRNSTQAEIQSAMRQVEIRLGSILEDSKSVSLDGVLAQAYRDNASGNKAALNQTASDYLAQKFSRNELYRAAFLFFPEDPQLLPYAANPGTADPNLIPDFTSRVLPAAQAAAPDTGIRFLENEGRLYLVAPLADEEETYALLILELETAILLQSLYIPAQNQVLSLTLDDMPISLGIETEIDMDPSRTADISHTSEVGGHKLVCDGQVIGLNIWATMPVLRWILLFDGSLVIPMLVIIVWLFHRNINRPIDTLIRATSHVQAGERGYQIHHKAPNSEFSLLYGNFNTMSLELDSQFRRLYEEQQALQQAKLRALQSQINPHFLNNTLEIINWEARFADAPRVCSMIEALSTMLDAAIGRDGRSQILLSEDLKYVDAYLYITEQRLGDRLTIRKDIAGDTLNCPIPLLLLQPVLENAVEYDLSRTGGELSIRTYLRDSRLHVEIEHDGAITPEGWEKILSGLRDDSDTPNSGRSVGIRNVVNRLRLIYGSGASFDIRETRPGRVLAELILPTPGNANASK